MFSLLNSFLSIVLLFNLTLVNSVPVPSVDGSNSTSKEIIPEPVNINGSSTSDLATTLEPVELTTNVAMLNPRNARADEGLMKLTKESSSEPDQNNDKSAIRFPREDEEILSNATAAAIPVAEPSSESPKANEKTTDMPKEVLEIGIDSNGTITEGLIETSSSSSSTLSTKIDLTSTTTTTTQKPLVNSIASNATEVMSSSTPSSNSSTVDSTRIGRSQPDSVDDESMKMDEINVNLTDTLHALATLSSVIAQTTVNDSLVTV